MIFITSAIHHHHLITSLQPKHLAHLMLDILRKGHPLLLNVIYWKKNRCMMEPIYYNVSK